eukprot:3599070-Amphidinium_carterae.1
MDDPWQVKICNRPTKKTRTSRQRWACIHIKQTSQQIATYLVAFVSHCGPEPRDNVAMYSSDKDAHHLRKTNSDAIFDILSSPLLMPN